MSTYTQIIYHFVFSTKHREPTMFQNQKLRLFSYIHHFLTNKNAIYTGLMG